MLRNWLAHPLMRGLSVDDSRTTILRRTIIRQKPFLRQIYQEWYGQIAELIPKGSGSVLELGAGAGFLRSYIPELIASDLLCIPEIDVVLDGLLLPFSDATLRGIVMIDVLHHLPAPQAFFSEAGRCVRKGGVVVMIEPWVTAWSRLIYGRLHHEPFNTVTTEWEFPSSGPLSGANGALPWIIFERDRARFQREFPAWKIASIDLQMPFRYLLSGGVSMRNLSPKWTFELWRAMETTIQPWMRFLAMFARIHLIKT